MPESSLPESDSNASHQTQPAHPTMGISKKMEPMSLLTQLQKIDSVQYAAFWPLPNVNSTAPQCYVGSISDKATTQQRQRCLSQVQQRPGQPFLLGDKSNTVDRNAAQTNKTPQANQTKQDNTTSVPSNKNVTTDEQQSAVLCLLCVSSSSLKSSAIIELQFEDSTSMQAATAILQQSARVIQKAGWQLGVVPPAGDVKGSSKLQFAGQSVPPSFSASGLAQPRQGNAPQSSPFPTGMPNPSAAQTNDEIARATDRFRNFSRQVHRTLDPQQTDLNVCSELADFLDCDRVSVLRKHRGKFKVQAITGQPSVNQRSKVVQQMQQLAEATLKQGKTFYAPNDQNLPKEIQKPLDAFQLTSDVRSLMILPVMAEAQELKREEADLRKANSNDTLIAGIVIESLKREIDFQQKPEVQAACEVASDAIRHSHQHRQLLFYPIWNWLGHTKVAAWSRRLPISVILLLLLLGISLLCFWPATFYVSSDGTLVPVKRDRIFAPKNGLVEQVYVKPNEAVTEGQPLIRMRDYELETQIQRVEKDIAVVSSNIEVQERWIRTGNKNERFANREDETPLSVLKEEKENLLRQMELLEKQKELLLVTSPIEGTVMTWRVDEDLLQRPVPFGRLMMEVAQIDGQWKLILNLPDRRIGHLLEAIQESDAPLQVEFVLAARPEQRYYGTLDHVALTTAASQDEGAFVKVEVSVDSEDLNVLQNETEVSAKIFCGKASLGYVWLHDIGEFLQKKVFFFTW